MRLGLVVLCGGALVAPLSAQRPAPAPREFRIDAGHSLIEFSIGFLAGRVRGQFDGVEGVISYDSTRGVPDGVAVVIPVRGIHTGSTHRDEHLLTDDFFDADRWPAITFRSVRASCRGWVCRLTGALTMRGVTRMVTFEALASGPPVEDPHGTTLLSFTASLRLARRDFGILGGSTHNSWFDAVRSATMSDSVDIRLEINAWDTDFARTRTFDAAAETLARDGVGRLATRLMATQAAHPDSLSGVMFQLESVARVLLRRGDVATALELLRLGIRLFPDSAAAYTALARGYEVAGQMDSARARAHRGLALRADEPRAVELLRRLSGGAEVPARSR